MIVIGPVIVGVLGAAVGSFLAVVIDRLPAGLSVVRPLSDWRTRSRPLSGRHALIEVVTALAFAGLAGWQLPVIAEAPSVAAAVAATLVLVALLYFAAISITLAAIDVMTHRLPNAIVLPSYIVVALLLGVAAIAAGDLERAVRAVAGAGVLFVFFLMLAAISPHGMGMGDVKLAGVIGLMLGWYGWGALAVGTLAAFVLGGVVGVALLLLRRAGRSTSIAFGPWMLAGAWVAIVLGEPIVRDQLDQLAAALDRHLVLVG